jgi:hypothetical protein
MFRGILIGIYFKFLLLLIIITILYKYIVYSILTERPDGMVSPQVGPLHRRQVAVPQIRFCGWPVR